MKKVVAKEKAHIQHKGKDKDYKLKESQGKGKEKEQVRRGHDKMQQSKETKK